MAEAAVVLELNPVARRVMELLTPHLDKQGFELVSVEYHKGTRSSMLRVLMDRPGGGIGLADLERLSPMLSDLLDVYDPIEGRYTLEVASPGINRPLVKLKDFQAYRGQRVRIRTFQPHEGRKLFAGRLAGVNGAGITAVHRSKNAWMSPGPSRSQISCRRSGSSQAANPLDNSVKPIPARVAACLECS